MIKELLPIGSVVLLKNGTKKLMVIGLKVTKKDSSNQTYDYIGVLYPEGFLGTKGNFLFNHSDITDVVFRGYVNTEQQEFVDLLEAVLEKAEDSLEHSGAEGEQT